MMTEEETANIVTLLEDLLTDLRNGNVPTSTLLIVSIVNCLLLKQPLEWKMLGALLIENLEAIEIRLALLQFVPVFKELVGSFPGETEARPE